MLTYALLSLTLLLIGGKFVILYRQKKRKLTEAEIDRRLLQRLNGGRDIDE